MRTTFYAVVLAAILGAGCAQDHKPNPNELAKQQWNAARAGVLCGLARQQYEAGNFDASRKTLDQAATLNPASLQLHILSARLAIEQGQLEVADRELKTARQLDPKSAEAAYLSGVVCQRWQQTQAAYQFYRQACEQEPGELAYLLAEAEMLVALDRVPEALAALQERVVYFENSAAIRDAVGQLLVQQGRYAEAIPMLRQATFLASDELPLREHLALAMYRGRQYRDAEQALDRLLQDSRCATRADLWTAMGECQLQLGEAAAARSSLQKASQLEPSSPGIWLSLAKAAMQLNDPQRAEASIQKAMALDPHNPEAHLFLGYLRLRQNRLDDALGAFRKVTEIDPSDAVGLCMGGYVLEKLGKPSEAMACYAQALKLRPNDELASKLMAAVEPRE